MRGVGMLHEVFMGRREGSICLVPVLLCAIETGFGFCVRPPRRRETRRHIDSRRTAAGGDLLWLTAMSEATADEKAVTQQLLYAQQISHMAGSTCSNYHE